MNDQQFDRLLKASLSWQADRAIDQQPRRLAMRRLAVRLQSPQALMGRRVVMLPVPAGGVLNLVLLVLLMLALVASVLVAGAILRRIAENPQRLFALEVPCDGRVALGEGVVLSFSAGDDQELVYADGRLVSEILTPFPDEAGGGRTAIVTGTSHRERRLGPRGVELMLAKVEAAGLERGCHQLRTQDAAGSVAYISDDGNLVSAWWSPTGSGLGGIDREATEAEEPVLVGLLEALDEPEAWLPDDAWLDPVERLVRPEQWIVIVSFDTTGLSPEDVLMLPDGGTLEGNDPRYRQLALPGGVEADKFGAAYGADGRQFRCGVIDSQAALALAESMDRLPIGTHSFDENGWMREEWGGGLFTTDLSMTVSIGMSPAGGVGDFAAADCDVVARMPMEEPSDRPPDPPPIEGALADVDACSLLTDDVLSTVEPQPGARPPLHPGSSTRVLPVPARTCFLSGMEWRGAGIFVALHPQSLSSGAARDLALALLGVDVEEREIGGVRLWANGCYTDDEPCTYGIAISAPPYLVVVEFQNMDAPMPDDRRLEYRAAYEQFIDALVASLPD